MFGGPHAARGPQFGHAWSMPCSSKININLLAQKLPVECWWNWSKGRRERNLAVEIWRKSRCKPSLFVHVWMAGQPYEQNTPCGSYMLTNYDRLGTVAICSIGFQSVAVGDPQNRTKRIGFYEPNVGACNTEVGRDSPVEDHCYRLVIVNWCSYSGETTNYWFPFEMVAISTLNVNATFGKKDMFHQSPRSMQPSNYERTPYSCCF